MKISLIYDGTNHYIQQDGKNIFFVSTSYRTSDCIYVASESAYFVPILSLYTLYNSLFLKPGFVYSSVSFADILLEEPFHDLFYFDNDNFILKDNIPEFVIYDSGNNIRNTLFLFGLCLEPVSDFDTDLYSELLDNTEQFRLAKNFLNDTDPAKELDPNYWTDIQLKFFRFVEEYNKNVLSLRSTKKVNANVSGSISQSGQQQDIDLTPITNQLLNLNSKFEITKRDSNNNPYTENITKVLDDKQDTKNLVVETIEKAPFNPYLNDDNNEIYGV